jgi:predicted secreted protein
VTRRGSNPVCVQSVLAIALLAHIGVAAAQTAIDVVPTQPIVSVTSSATSNVANDRMHALLRAEADNADPAQAASDVNARMARALARARGVTGIEASTAGYSSFQITEPNKPPRWRVSQTLALEGADFAALAGLVSRLQSTDGLVLASLSFSVSAATRRAAEDALTQQAIRNWQQRAQAAAQGFGAGGWRAGRITIQTNDFGRPQPMYRASAVADSRAPVAVEGGMSEVTVTVSGEAILDTVRAGR